MLPKLNLGGGTLKPAMFAISYPGASREVLFKVLHTMKLKLSETGGDVHVMDDLMVELEEEDEIPLPEEWFDEFRDVEGWSDLLFYLSDGESISDVAADVKANGTGITAPRWFVEGWGKAAIHAAANCDKTGSGVVVLRCWEGYESSPWCELEFRFCKVLSALYPKSVYVVADVNETSGNVTGYYIQSAASKFEEQMEKETEAESMDGRSSVVTRESDRESFEGMSARIRRVFGKTSATRFDEQKEVEATLQGWDERDSDFEEQEETEAQSLREQRKESIPRERESMSSGSTGQSTHSQQARRVIQKSEIQQFDAEGGELIGDGFEEESSDDESEDGGQSEDELSLHYF